VDIIEAVACGSFQALEDSEADLVEEAVVVDLVDSVGAALVAVVLVGIGKNRLTVNC
jgi:hypothetical protein